MQNSLAIVLVMLVAEVAWGQERPAPWSDDALVSYGAMLEQECRSKETEDRRLLERLLACENPELAEPANRTAEFLMVALGHRQATVAIPTLIERIDRESKLPLPPTRHGWPLNPGGRWKSPAFEGLVYLGMPSCWAALEELPKEESIERRRLFAELVATIASIPAAKALLQERADKAIDPTHNQRLLEALQIVNDMGSKPDGSGTSR
jgi:hypothetical protein